MEYRDLHVIPDWGFPGWRQVGLGIVHMIALAVPFWTIAYFVPR